MSYDVEGYSSRISSFFPIQRGKLYSTPLTSSTFLSMHIEALLLLLHEIKDQFLQISISRLSGLATIFAA